MSESLPIEWQIVGMVGVIVGGLGAAVGGIAAWRAAAHSAASSKNALDALALGIKPSVTNELTHLYQGEAVADEPIAVIRNDSEWDALDIDVEILRRDGRRVKASVQRLASERTAEDEEDTYIHVNLGELDPSLPEQWRNYLELNVRRVRVRFSDYRSIARYEWTCSYDYDFETGAEFEGMGGEQSEREERIK